LVLWFFGSFLIDFTKDFAARGEWQRYKDVGDLNTTGQGDVDFIGVSLVYKL